MSDLPDDFDCTLTNWEYIYGLCRNVSNAVKRADFEPDVVVALARGGWFAGRCICDFLGLNDLTSLKMEHYVGAAEKSDEPQIRYPMPEGSVEGKDVLIIDDIADTGGSIRRAEEYVDDRDAGEVGPPRSNCSVPPSSSPTSSANGSNSGRGSSTRGTSSKT